MQQRVDCGAHLEATEDSTLARADDEDIRGQLLRRGAQGRGLGIARHDARGGLDAFGDFSQSVFEPASNLFFQDGVVAAVVRVDAGERVLGWGDHDDLQADVALLGKGNAQAKGIHAVVGSNVADEDRATGATPREV